MKNKKVFQLYTGMWLVAILFLFVLLWQNMGDARIINYSGLVRGATQRLVKEELNGQSDDRLISYIDGIIYDLQTGEGDYQLDKSSCKEFQDQLSDLNLVWEDMKKEILLVRSGNAESDLLFTLSQKHFEIADRLVQYAEENSNQKLLFFTVLYFLCLLVSITVFGFVYKKYQRDLMRSISTDKLTGLLNRIGFEERAASLLRQHPKTKYAIIEFDINQFKAINVACGYPLGDRLLNSLASAVASWQGENQACARIDADDFVLLAEQSDTLAPDLEAILAQVVSRLAFLEPFGGIGFTYGAYEIRENTEPVKTIMDKANTAHKTAKLYEHKALVWYDQQLVQKLNLENKYKEQMHHGLAAEEFKLFLQPKVDLSRMEVMGAEALVRWDLPGCGLVYPDSYIPLFEKDGTIAELDFYMLKRACLYLRERADTGADLLSVSVNFSRVTLYQPQFYETFLEIVEKWGIPHRLIEVEVTESAFHDISDAVLSMLSRLHDAGFLVSMDDFGAGYSNLNMLSRLPIQIIKLDKEFICEIDRNENMKGIITCAVELAHTMGIKVVCEGVESEEHLAFLQKIGCDYVQGYYFSKPLPEQVFSSRYCCQKDRGDLVRQSC